MLTKKTIKTVIEPLFANCNSELVSINGYSVDISIWRGMYLKDALKDLVNIFSVVNESPFFKDTYDVWREVGYYDSTEDITIQITINKEEVKKYLSKL